MAEKKSKLVQIKTKPTASSVDGFLEKIDDKQKREDSYTLLDMMKKATGAPPRLWGTSIIGFGENRIKSAATGREVDWFRIGFSPRKAALSLYLFSDAKKHEATLKKLGKYKTGAGCLYIKKLDDVDVKVLEGMIRTVAGQGKKS